MITIENLSKGYKHGDGSTLSVVEDVSFTLPGKGVASVLGPNGVGKTTVMKMLIGAVSPDAGQILVDGAPPTNESVRYVPQNCPVLPWRKVMDDICLRLEIAGYSKKERYRHAEELMDKIGIELPLKQRSYTLSGGQRQLVNICRALVGPERPSLICMDEPFSALDPSSRLQFLAHFDVILESFQTQIIFTAHDLELAVLASDTVVTFRSMPVTVDSSDIMEVHLPRPRERKMLTMDEFHRVHSTVTERLFGARGALC